MVKLGSALLTNGKGEINESFIADVCEQVSCLITIGHRVLIVSSGAIASDEHTHRSNNLRAAIGQSKLMNIYSKYFHNLSLEVAQLLLTDDYLSEGKTKIAKEVINDAFNEKVICIVNANDVIDDQEIKALKYCADNDVLAKLICRLIEADMIIIGFTEAGLKDNNNKVVHEAKQYELDQLLNFAKGGNELGHGEDGMLTKIKTLWILASDGLTAILAPDKEPNFILRAYNGERKFGTRFCFKNSKV